MKQHQAYQNNLAHLRNEFEAIKEKARRASPGERNALLVEVWKLEDAIKKLKAKNNRRGYQTPKTMWQVLGVDE